VAYHLTRRAFLQLIEIRERSLRDFGEQQTDRFIQAIYRDFARAYEMSDRDDLRAERSAPFCRQPVGPSHFALYHRFDNTIIIAAIFGQMMDVEAQVARLRTRLAKEIAQMRQTLPPQPSSQ
jgi:plasmid stabilization system protein ParE